MGGRATAVPVGRAMMAGPGEQPRDDGLPPRSRGGIDERVSSTVKRRTTCPTRVMSNSPRLKAWGSCEPRPPAPASLHALLSNLFALRFAHPFVYRLMRRRFPMTLPGASTGPRLRRVADVAVCFAVAGDWSFWAASRTATGSSVVLRFSEMVLSRVASRDSTTNSRASWNCSRRTASS